jgi:hypothetical protein
VQGQLYLTSTVAVLAAWINKRVSNHEASSQWNDLPLSANPVTEAKILLNWMRISTACPHRNVTTSQLAEGLEVWLTSERFLELRLCSVLESHNLSWNVSTFLELEASLPCVQQSATGPYPQLDECSPHPDILFMIHFNIIPKSTPRALKWSLPFGLFDFNFEQEATWDPDPVWKRCPCWEYKPRSSSS